MKGYLAILRIRMKVFFQYRAAAFAGICTQVFWAIVNVMIFRAFFQESSSSTPISLNQTITFIWLGQALVQILPWNIDKEIEAQVKNGNVAYELVRPLNLYGLWFSRSFAMRFIPTLLRFFPIIAIGSFLGLSAPVSLEGAVFFTLSICLAFILSSSITTFVIVSQFWTLSGEGIQRLLPSFTLLLSGMIVPLPLFPKWAQSFLNIQPFRGIMDIPCRLYTGVIPASDGLYYLGFQLMWIIIIILLGKMLLHKAIRKFVIQGG